MQIKIIALLVALIASGGIGTGAYLKGYSNGESDERLAWQSKTDKIRADASEQARQVERTQQEAARNAIQNQLTEERYVAATLRADINSLRERPPRTVRVEVPGAPTDCQGSTGQELSRPDAEFLTGLAARADNLRAALNACYEWSEQESSE